MIKSLLFLSLALFAAADHPTASPAKVLFHSDPALFALQTGEHNNPVCEDFSSTSLDDGQGSHCTNDLSASNLQCIITRLQEGFSLSSVATTTTDIHDEAETHLVFFTKPRINMDHNTLLVRYADQMGVLSFDSDRVIHDCCCSGT